MKLDLDSRSIEFPCPHCGQKLNETIGRLKSNPQLICTECGKTFGVDADELRKGIDAVQKSLDDFGAMLRKLGK